MADYRRFTKNDWDAFGGAEAFSATQEPFMYERAMNDGHVEISVIVDRNGFEINFFGDADSEEILVYTKERKMNSMIAEGELRQLIKVIEEYDYAPDLTYELDHPTHEATKGFDNNYIY